MRGSTDTPQPDGGADAREGGEVVTLDAPGPARFRRTQLEPDPLIGQRLADKYEIREVIGRGGLGTVYAGVQHPIGREVAVKVIARHRAGDAVLRRRFQREAHAAARLKHPAIVALFDFGEDRGELFMVMERVDGRELRDHLRPGEPLPPARVVKLARQVLAGLAHAHHAGLVHRDLKPENIMISEGPFGGERAQILDFGIVKTIREDAVPDGHETRAGVIMGTPAYLAPEQAYSRGVGPATDQYSMGVVLYEALTGRLPYSRGSEFEIMTAHCVAPYPPMPAEAQVPPALEAVVQRAMAKDPGDRYPSVRELAEALEAALDAPLTEARVTAREGPAPEGALTGPGPAPMDMPSLDTDEHRALLAVTPDAPLPTAKVAWMVGVVLLLGGIGVWALLPADEPPAVVAVTARPAPSAPPQPLPVEGLGGRAWDPLEGRGLPDPAPPDAAVDAAPERTGPRPAPRPKPRPKPPPKTAAPPVGCVAEWAALRNDTASQRLSLTPGSVLCKRATRLERRISAGGCEAPIEGITTLMEMCR